MKRDLRDMTRDRLFEHIGREGQVDGLIAGALLRIADAMESRNAGADCHVVTGGDPAAAIEDQRRTMRVQRGAIERLSALLDTERRRTAALRACLRRAKAEALDNRQRATTGADQ